MAQKFISRDEVTGRLVEVEAKGGAAGAPTLIESGVTFKIEKNIQVLFTEEIELEQDAEIECDQNGILTEVN